MKWSTKPFAAFCLVAACCACSNPSEKPDAVPLTVSETPTLTTSNADYVAEVVATVGDEKLTRAALDAAVKEQFAMAKQAYGVLPETPEEIAQLTRMIQQSVIERFISERILTHLAALHHITVTDEDIAAAQKEFEDGTGMTFEDSLKQFPGGEEKARKLFMTELLTGKVLDQLAFDKIKVDEAEIAASVAKVKEENKTLADQLQTLLQEVKEGKRTFDEVVAENSVMTVPTTLPVDQLEANFPPHVVDIINAIPEGGFSDLICDDDAGIYAVIKVLKRTQPDVETTAPNAQMRLAAIRERILAGEDFATLAAEVSECPSGQREGGSLGSFSKGMMVPEFEKVAFELPIGEISPVFETPFGFHIVKVTARDEAAGTVTAFHILMSDEVVSPMIELQLLVKPATPVMTVEAEGEKQRALKQERAFYDLMTEQIKAQEVTCPLFPELLETISVTDAASADDETAEVSTF